MLRQVIFLVLATLLADVASAQLSRTHIGGGATPYALSTDYRAIGFNPALMTVSGWGGGAIGTSGSFEGGFMLSSKAFARADLWNQILEPSSTNSAAWTQQEWVAALAEEQLDMGVSFMTMGMARQWGKWSVGYVNRRSIQSSVRLGDPLASLLAEGGLGLYDNIDVGGVIMDVEDFDPSMADSWTGVMLDSTLNQAAILQGTDLRFQSVKSHELGVAKCWGDPTEGWQIHTGVTGRYLMGSALFELSSSEDEVKAFNAASDGFSYSTLQNLDSMFTMGFSPNISDVFNPAGEGWGADIGLVVSQTDRLWITASVVDLGAITWKGRSYNTTNVTFDGDMFGSSDSALQPEDWLDGAVDLFDAGAWFGSGTDSTIVQTLKPTYSLGAAFRPWVPFVVAGNVTATSKNEFAQKNVSMGLTAGVQITKTLFLETGVQQNHLNQFRVPVACRLVLKSGWEMGVRLGDVSVLWNDTQHMASAQWCFLRWHLNAF